MGRIGDGWVAGLGNRWVIVFFLDALAQRDFTDFLPMCQYAFNTAKHAALKASPYYASWGCHPRNPTMFRAKTSVCEFPAVEEFVSHQQTVLHQVKNALFQAQRTMPGRVLSKI